MWHGGSGCMRQGPHHQLSDSLYVPVTVNCFGAYVLFLRTFSQNCEKRLLALSCPCALSCVRIGKFRHPLDGFSWNLIFGDFFFENLRRKFKFQWNLSWISGSLHEDQYTFMIISCQSLIRRKNVSDKSCRENQNTHFMFNNFCTRKSFRLWDNTEKYCRAGQVTEDNIIWHMGFTCWIPKATDTHSEYVILIAFPLQQLLRESPSVLRLFISCISCLNTYIVSLRCMYVQGSFGK